MSDASDASDGPTAASTAEVGTLTRDPRMIAISAVSAVGILGFESVSATLPAIGTGLGVSDARLGLVMTAFFLPTIVAIPIVGAIADIYGRRRVTLVLTAVFGLAGLGAVFAPDFRTLLALRVVQGAAFAATTPLSVALLGDFFRGAAGTTAQGIRSSVNGAVLIAGPAAAGALAGFGWQYAFLLFGLALPVTALVYAGLPETRERDRDRRVRDEVRAYGGRFGGSLRDRNLLVLLLGGFAIFVVRNGVLTIAPLFAVRELGASAFVGGILLSVLGVVRIVASPFAGRLVAHTTRRIAFAATMGIVVAGMVAFAFATSLAGAVVGVAGFALGMSLFNPVLNDAVVATADPGSRAGVVGGMMLFKNAANVAAPAGFTLLLGATDFATVFLAAAAVALGYVGLVTVALDDAY